MSIYIKRHRIKLGDQYGKRCRRCWKKQNGRPKARLPVKGGEKPRAFLDYEGRKGEIIGLFLKTRSVPETCWRTDIPRTTMYELLIKWKLWKRQRRKVA